MSILSFMQGFLVCKSEIHLPAESIYCGCSGFLTSHTTATCGSTFVGDTSAGNDPATACKINNTTEMIKSENAVKLMVNQPLAKVVL